jgi:hypothetical protein
MTGENPLRPFSEQIVAMVLEARSDITEDAIRQALGAGRQQGWGDLDFLFQVYLMLRKGDDCHVIIDAATKGVRRR